MSHSANYRNHFLYLLVFLLPVTLCFGQQGRARIMKGRPLNQVKIIALPGDIPEGKASVERALADLDKGCFPSPLPALTPLEMGPLGWAAQVGVNSARANAVLLNNGQATIIDEMIVLFAIHDGLYRYVPGEHKLEKVSLDDMRARLMQALFGHPAVLPACGMILARVPQGKYSRPTFAQQRLLYLTVGQIAQTIHLQATSLGLTAFDAGHLDARLVRDACGFLRNVEPLHVILLGHQTQGTSPSGEGQDQAGHTLEQSTK